MYIQRNLNPKGKKTDDCAIRAVAAATGLDWLSASRLLTKHAEENYTVLNSSEAVEKALLSVGFIKGKINVSKGSRRPTVRSFSEDYPNIIAVLRVANHFTACGDKSVYSYWYKPIK